jgi:hypothetical protein
MKQTERAWYIDPLPLRPQVVSFLPYPPRSFALQPEDSIVRLERSVFPFFLSITSSSF